MDEQQQKELADLIIGCVGLDGLRDALIQLAWQDGSSFWQEAIDMLDGDEPEEPTAAIQAAKE